MAEPHKGLHLKISEAAPATRQTVKFLTAAAIGTALLVLSGLTLTGTVVCLVMATPVLVLFTPILLPAGFVIALAAAGLLFSGGFGVAALSALAWIYNYATGKHPPGSDQLESARMKLASTARDVKERAKEYGHYVQSKAQEVTSHATAVAS